MFLKYLTISDDNENIIRFIEFKKGLNLILSNSNSDNHLSSNNNVGKTTFLKVIDFCLGSKDGKEIYTDQEFNRKDEKLFEYIKDFSFELQLSDDTRIRRTIKNHTKIFIDNIEYSINNSKKMPYFDSTLKKILFKIDSSKPSFRELIEKFIRNNTEKMENTIKAFGKSHRNSYYELIYFTLFGFKDILEYLNTKNTLLKELKIIENGLSYFKNSPQSALETEISIFDKNIKKISKQITEFKFDNFFKIYEDDLKNLTEKIRDARQNIGILNFQLENSKKSLESLNYSIDIEAVKYIYQEVGKFNESMHKKFDEVSEFHNKVILDRSKYYLQNIIRLEKLLSKENHNLKMLRQEESKYFQNIDGNPSLDDYNKMMNKKTELIKEKTEKESKILEIINLTKQKSDVEISLTKVQQTIDDLISIKYKSNINTFNEFFTDFTKKLYGEEWYLYPINDKSGKNILFEIDKVGGTGTGVKKAEIVAFDLSYINYINKLNLDFPKFVIHDGIDQISENQKNDIIFELANEINGQYILAINLDQLPNNVRENIDFIKQNTILELSDTNKLFKF